MRRRPASAASRRRSLPLSHSPCARAACSCTHHAAEQELPEEDQEGQGAQGEALLELLALPSLACLCPRPPIAPSLHPSPAPRPQVVREHYLRDDIYSGSPLDPECPPDACKLSGDAPHYLLIDTNVALHQVGYTAPVPPLFAVCCPTVPRCWCRPLAALRCACRGRQGGAAELL